MSKSNSASSAIFGIYRLLLISLVFIVIYHGQTIVIPLTMAALLTFLLSPLVSYLEKWIGRVAAILLAALVVFTVVGVTGYVFAKQLTLFGSNFQNYYQIIQAKIRAFHIPYFGFLNQFGQIIDNIRETLLGPEAISAYPKNFPQVKLIDLSSTFANFIETLFGSIVNLIGMTGIVLLLVIFMLLNREDIRGRLIKLIGQGKISSTTNALNDASDRVFIYLYRLFIVNVGFGVAVACGLFFLGIPSFILWGCLAAILRFIPYIGAWIAALIPIILSWIISDSWLVPSLTIAYFIILEIATAYFVEPYYYGVGTGVSSFALVVAAIFWTWLWGPIGLLLSTPLTVCLVVLGQHVTNMSFLRVMLSQEKALTPAEECYHRLLSSEPSESMDLVEAYLQKNSTLSLYDSVLAPILSQAEMDTQLENIEPEKKEEVFQGIRDIIEFINESESKENGHQSLKGSVLCLPAKGVRDELAVMMLAALLAAESFEAHYTAKIQQGEITSLIEKGKSEAVCIAAVFPYVLSHIRLICSHIHKRNPKLTIIVALLGHHMIDAEITEKLLASGATKVVNTFAQTLNALKEIRTNK